jgi:hypothetical protein
MRINFSRRGIGVSAGVKGFRVGTGPRGPYVAGGRGGIYFRQRLGGAKHAATRAAPFTPAPRLLSAQAAPQSPSMPPPPRTSPTGQPIVTPPAVPPPQSEIRPPRYPAWALFTLSGAFALSWLLAIIAAAPSSESSSSTAITNPVLQAIFDIAVALIIGVQVAVCALDWHGFTTLDERIVWARLQRWPRIGLIVAYLCVWIMPGVYLGFACRDWLVTTRATNERAPLEQQRRISELESELGILPQTEGACRICHKPLQVGAQFCTYCRAPVQERARVCPACGAAALPDGQFCPKCGAEL